MERPEGWRRAVEFIAKSDLVGDVYEFGCYRGTSLTHLYRAAVEFEPMVGKRFLERFFAFDSFQGMPAGGELDRLEGYDLALGTLAEGRYAVTTGEFTSALNANGVDLSRLQIIEGFYEEVLIKPSTVAACGQSRCALLHIDCDFEVSATAALEFMTPRLQDGSVVLFDDWFCFAGDLTVVSRPLSPNGCPAPDMKRPTISTIPGFLQPSFCISVRRSPAQLHHHDLRWNAHADRQDGAPEA